ncbi:MAG: glycosyl transferase [Bacteroidetes bacterium]|nr:MAG: glycosyl transferase [Bacteroidota bacterium]
MVKFLIIRFSSIGDIVLTSPVVRILKNQVDGAKVHFLTKPQYASLVENNPNIDKIHVLKPKLNDTITELRNEFFDYIIDLHNNIRTYRIKSALKIVDFSFNKLNKEKWIYVNFKKNRLPDIHIVDRYLETIKLFDTKNDNKGLDFFIPEKDTVDISKFNFKENKFAAFVIGAKHFTKQMPQHKVIDLCNKIALPIVLLGGKEDAEKGKIIKQASNSVIYNFCGEFNINQSASIIKQASFVISHDTGLMHIAAAFKKDIISIWGNTVPEFGMYPYLAGEKSKIFEVKNLKCRPCSKIGFSKCPKKHFKCMNDINNNEILDYINKNFK